MTIGAEYQKVEEIVRRCRVEYRGLSVEPFPTDDNPAVGHVRIRPEMGFVYTLAIHSERFNATEAEAEIRRLIEFALQVPRTIQG